MSYKKNLRLFSWGLGTPLLIAATAGSAFAEEAAQTAIDSGDTAWILTSSALVLFMTVPGLALFYGGLVSQRNVLSTLMHSFFLTCLISVQWVLWGYSLAFGSDIGGIIGGFDYLFFNGVGPEANGSIPHLAFAMFQCMFAIITVALISGTFAERMNFKAFVIFSLLWATFVYDPLCHWVWQEGGWLYKLGALDFAGGTVVHISSGVTALVACTMIGKRIGYPQTVSPPHNLPLTLIGGSMLWFGWFGFNAGSSLGANGLAAIAFTVTNTAAATAGLAWVFVEWAHRGKPTILGCVTGAVAGLVAITPASGFVSVPSALIIGFGAGVICYLGVNYLKEKFGYDDSLDVFGVHGLGGTWGALATGIFASTSVNPNGADGLLYGNAAQFVNQIVSVLAGWALAGIGTFVILLVVKAFVPLRAEPEDEMAGLDLSVHGEVAYNYTSTGMSKILE
ncbi:MAG: ammonium transporter [Candidatus Omnitrophota bacterium]|nr:MAG: ammonium transporter [Candidatus Omnitrophota bacterium]